MTQPSSNPEWDQPVAQPGTPTTRTPPHQPRIDAGRLWAGGAATAIVAALVATVGVVVTRDVLGVRPVRPVVLLGSSSSLVLSWAVTALVAGLLATGLLHILLVSTPRPRLFFGWIIALLTVATVASPFAASGTMDAKVATALINLLVGVAIGSLLVGVARLTVRLPEDPPEVRY